MKPQNMWVAQAAAIEAITQLELIGPPWDQEIDIFSIIEDARIPLMFRPMKRLFGAYIPAEDTTGSKEGILINACHPRSLQRYTAAHEFGHHIQDRCLSLDEEMEVLGRTRQVVLDPRERFAEHFASWFLMPPQLVKNLAKRLDINLAQPESNSIYQLSLSLGASYAATVTQLLSLREITLSQARGLRARQPKEIKENISWDGCLSNPRGDIWVMTQKFKGHSVHPRVGDEIYLSLSETPSTGYVWVRTDSESIPDLVEQRFVEAKSGTNFGAEGRRKLRFALTGPGASHLVLSMQRPWLGIQSEVDDFRIKLSVEGERLGISPVFFAGPDG